MRIEGYGISLELPPGWEGLITLSRDDTAPGSISRPVVQAGNFPLPPPQAIEAYGYASVRGMVPRDAFVALPEMNPDYAGVGLYSEKGFPRLRPSDFSPSTLEVGMSGRVGVQRFVHVAGRTFAVYAVVAAMEVPSETDVAGLNSVLSSLSVAPPRRAYYYYSSPTPT
jgi:hypothetical protein